MNVTFQRGCTAETSRSSQETPLLQSDPKEKEGITEVTTRIFKSNKSSKNSQEPSGINLEDIENEAFKPWGCCLRQTTSLIKNIFAKPKKDSEGFTGCNKIVHMLAIQGDTESINKLIENGNPEHDFNELNKKGYSPLYLAVTHKRMSAVEAILKYENINYAFQSPGYHKTVLHRAAERKLEGICNIILKACPEEILSSFVDLKDLGGRTALYIAAENGYTDIARSLIAYGATPQITGPKGKTPLMAIPNFSCFRQCRKVLIEAEKNPDSIKTANTQSNLLKSIENGNFSQIEDLINVGAELDIVDEYGNGPFLLIVKSKLKEDKMLELIKLIRASRLSSDDINRKNANDETVLHITIKKGYNLILEEITNKMTATSQNTDLDQPNVCGNTALHLAIEEENDFAIERLLGVGANFNAQNKAGDTPLHCAVRQNYKTAVSMLLKDGAGVNVQNNVGNAPLHLSRDRKISKKLIQCGANIMLKNLAEFIPLDFAIRRESSDQNATKILAASPDIKFSEAAALSGNSEISEYCAKREKEEKITPNDILPFSERKSDKGKVGKNLKKQIREHGEKIVKKKTKELLDMTDNVGSKALQGGEQVATKVIETTVEGATSILENGKNAATEIVKVIKDGAVETVTFGRDTGLDIIKTSVAMSKPAAIAGGLLTDVLEKGKVLAKKDIDNWGSKKDKADTITIEASPVEESVEEKEESKED